ncbi:ATP-grasp domain-containing protein [Vibrio sp. 99-8-1]|uniref:D-alanine--D-alanine ligase family protein n=1 Tax=Vibrio sp. 99-8-1 TaxID=2607602 RepID=UPI00149339CF|nr:ATP-grasp domain-containing protein [Vibrio sp. 99-8-1]NOI64728.1 ATP-grasp domain-containing protein [Vibrio sp. 99-8-1]
MNSNVFSTSQMAWIRDHIKLAVIHGGDNEESEAFIYKNLNPRSTKTYQPVAHDIANALRSVGFQSVSVLAEDRHLATQLANEKIDLVITNSGGLQGFDSMCHLPSLLEMLGVPYVGHSPMTAGILDNKHLFKHEIGAAGIRTAPFITLQADESVLSPACQRELDSMEERFSKGFIVKPVSGRASIHVYPVFEREKLDEVVSKVQQATGNTVLIEPYLSGREFVVAVAGETVFRQGALHRLGKPFSFSITERVLGSDEAIFTSMDVKPITQDRLLAVRDEALRAELSSIGEKIYQLLALQTLVRVDLRMDDKGTLYVLETNPKPDLKMPCGNKVSLVCHDLHNENMSYTDLVQSMVFNRLIHLKESRPTTVAHCFNSEFEQLDKAG